MTLSASHYQEMILKRIEAVGGQPSVGQAADLLAEALQAGGVIQAFGCGHSEALAMEIAGGPAAWCRPTGSRCATSSSSAASRRRPRRPELERTPSVAHRLYDLAPVKPDDTFVIASNSGVNGAIVEMAQLVKQRGHALIAITSREHSARVLPRGLAVPE